RPGRLPEHAAHLLAELRLLLHEGLHRAVQVAAHEALQRVAVEADDLAEQLGREHWLPVLLVLGDDLQQHLPGQVLAALGVADLEVLAVDDQLADVLDGDVARNVGVVEATVRILLDDARLGHGAKALTERPCSMAQCSTGCKERGGAALSGPSSISVGAEGSPRKSMPASKRKFAEVDAGVPAGADAVIPASAGM